MAIPIKVDRLRLIEALEKEKKRLLADFKARMEKFRQVEAAYPARLAKHLRAVLVKLDQGRLPSKETATEYRNGTSATIPKLDLPAVPLKPVRDGRVCQIENLIAQLRLSTQKDIPVDQYNDLFKLACPR